MKEVFIFTGSPSDVPRVIARLGGSSLVQRVSDRDYWGRHPKHESLQRQCDVSTLMSFRDALRTEVPVVIVDNDGPFEVRPYQHLSERFGYKAHVIEVVS